MLTYLFFFLLIVSPINPFLQDAPYLYSFLVSGHLLLSDHFPTLLISPSSNGLSLSSES